MRSTQRKSLAILGSTGTLGTQALAVVRDYPGLFSVEALVAWNNADLLISQSREFIPDAVVMVNNLQYKKVKQALEDLPIKVFSGVKAITQLMEFKSFELVFNALRGVAGLEATLRAIETGKTIALANKELMVIAGHLLSRLSKEKQVNIFPVDSEHSAIFQCLVGEYFNPIEKIYLTASGGPFLGKKKAYLEHVSSLEALKHPNWDMGNKISIDSATLMNKGMEVIEAKWFFGLAPKQIEVIIHPQSVIHSIVQFQDGSMKAQMGLPDMRIPILYALNYPYRVQTSFERFSFTKYQQLSFEAPDRDSFPCLDLAYAALEAEGNMPCIMNAANETAVSAFLAGKINFTKIPLIIENCMKSVSHITDPNMEQLLETHDNTCEIAKKHV